MLLFRRFVVFTLLALTLALCGPSADALAQSSHSEYRERQRRLRTQREDRERWAEERRLRAAHCAEVGPEQCERERQASNREFMESFAYPALRWLIVGALAIGGFLWWRARSAAGGRGSEARRATSRGSTSSSLDLVVIDIALQPVAAHAVRDSIERAVARSVSIETAVSDAATALLLARAGWTHAAVRSWPLAAADVAEQRYRTLVAEAASRAAAEPSLMRDPGAGYRGTPDHTADQTPVVMASLTVCVRDEIPEQGGAVVDAASAVLHALSSLATDRVYRADLTWLPATSGEAITAAELVRRHPRLIAIVPAGAQSTQPGTTDVS